MCTTVLYFHLVTPMPIISHQGYPISGSAGFGAQLGAQLPLGAPLYYYESFTNQAPVISGQKQKHKPDKIEQTPTQIVYV